MCIISDPSSILGWIYFKNFVFFATFEFLNLIIGIIISNMDDLKEKGKIKAGSRAGKAMINTGKYQSATE